MKKWHIIFLLLLVAGTVVIMRQNHAAETPYQKEEGVVFGTVYHTTYQCDTSVQKSIVRELQRVDDALSMFNPLSTISKINNCESFATDPLFREVFTLSQMVSQATGGDFDITVAPLVNAWGFGFKSGELPDSAAVDSLLRLVGWDKVRLLADGTVEKADERMVLDCSAVAKGYGVDRVALLFDSLGITNYMIEIGGEIVAKGSNPKGKLWSIGVNKPVEDSTSLNRDVETVLEMTDFAMATSGNYRNYYTTEEGRRIAHTIDPHTGFPIQQDILSSTVIAPSCAQADAYATAFMVMGLDKAKQPLRGRPELKAYFICADADGNDMTWASDNLKLTIAGDGQ